METTTSHITEKDWKLNPIKTDKGTDRFSADDLIDAYFNGKRDQVDEEKQLRLDKLKENIEKASNLSVEIFNHIGELGFRCEMIFLKVKSIYNFTSLFLIEEDDYCDDRFLEVYKKTISIKNVSNVGKTFDFTTIMTPSSDSFDKKSVLADGYILSYGKPIHESEARTA